MLFENIGRHIDAFFNNISAHLRGEVREAKATYAQAMHDIASAYAADTRRLADATEEIAKHLSVLASTPETPAVLQVDPIDAQGSAADVTPPPPPAQEALAPAPAPEVQPDAPTPLEPALVAVATPQDQETAPPQQTAYVPPQQATYVEQPVAAPVAPTPYLPPQ